VLAVTSTMNEAADARSRALRARLLQLGRRFAVPLPDAAMALVFAVAALMDVVPFAPAMMEWRGELLFVLLVEGGFLLMQGTLVDIATRLKKRPPLWVIPIIAGVVVLFSDHARLILQMAWERGAFVFIPLVISLGERATVLWRMPDRPRVEKIAARALIANRITTGLALLALMTLTMVAGVIWTDLYLDDAWPVLTAGAVYFAVAAFDAWRVRGRRFAERPSVLFRFDLMHISYLEPVS
jgi:hypothetical protein